MEFAGPDSPAFGDDQAAAAETHRHALPEIVEFRREQAIEYAGDQAAAGDVVAGELLLVAARSRQAQAIRQRTEQRDRNRQEPENAGRKLDIETGSLEPTADAMPGISAEMPRGHVLGGPQKWIGRNGRVKPPARYHQFTNRREERRVVLDMLDHVEQADGRQRRWFESGLVGHCADDRLEPATPGVRRAGMPGLHRRDLEAGGREG